MGGASAVLSRPWLFAALAAGLGVYYGVSSSLWSASTWWDVAFLALVAFPAVFALVYLVLPVVGRPWLVFVASALVGLAGGTTAAGLGAVADFAKLAAATSVGFVLLAFLDDLPLAILIASIIPFVDAWSTWRGPTHTILRDRREIFGTFSFAFPIPGEHYSANLGLPDLLFFAFFLAACVRFRLRVGWTWLAMTASLGVTLTIAGLLCLDGLAALPGLSIGFLGANADLLWRRRDSLRFHLKPK